AIFVKDTASLRPVKGGVDEPLPRVSSHEIGHAMGLVHRQDTINLMASGTTGWSINDAEVDAVRTWAAQQDWVLTPAGALDKGYFGLLASIPGDSALKEKARAALRKSAEKKE
ncbi:MAG TPA: Matrixin, partial [Planctomycetota bacterium]|nr:Matrixin [Planctomycetota bacterium]